MAGRRLAGLLLVVLAATAGHLCAAKPLRVVEDPNTPVTYECLVPEPTNSDAADQPHEVAAASDKAKRNARAAAHAAAVASAAPKLSALGADVKGSYGRHVSVLMTPKQARKAGASGACQAIRRSLWSTPAGPSPPQRAERQQAAAALQATAASPAGQAVKAMGLEAARALHPDLLGKGVKVGIISDSYFAKCTIDTCTFLPNCDTAKNANVLQDYGGGSDKGRAMAELICQVAPEVELSFWSGAYGAANFASGIQALANQAGAQIIVDGLTYFSEPWFSPGVIHQAVDAAYTWYEPGGLVYFSATGDNAGNAWEGASNWKYVAPVTPAHAHARGLKMPAPTPTGYHDFGTASQYFLAVTGAANRVNFYLQWDEPDAEASGYNQRPSSNLQLLVCLQPSFTGTCHATSYDNINGGQPFDWLALTGMSGTTVYVAVHLIYTIDRYDPMRFKLIFDGGYVAAGQGTNSWGASTCVGQANAMGAIAVGAAYYRDTPAFNGGKPPQPEPFTSWGGQLMLMDEWGDRLPEPSYANKPDIVAPDGTGTSFYNAGSDADQTGLPEFFGTSAAAAHAAAVAALMLQLDPWARYDVANRMRSSAIDMLAPGEDRVTGPGYIDGTRALLGCSAANIGDSCVDGRPCMVSGICKPDLTCVGVSKCKPPTDCQTATCNTGTFPESCSYAFIPDGTPCNGGAACSVGTCSLGTCVHRRALPEGTPCDDGDKCTDDDRCRLFSRAAGRCIGTRKNGVC